MLNINLKENHTVTRQDLNNLDGSKLYNVICDDGSVVSTKERLLISWFHWGMNREYGITPTVSQVLSADNEFVAGDDRILQEAAINTIYYRLVEEKPDVHAQELMRRVLEHTAMDRNDLFNYVCMDLTAYGNCITALSFYEIMNDDEFLELEDIPETEESLELGMHKSIEIMTSDRYRTNPVSRIVRKGITSGPIASQMTFSRQYTTDINSRIFPIPIRPSYMDGIQDVVLQAMETRSAAKAKLYENAPMSDTEYLHRKLQIIMEYLYRFEGDLRVGRDYKVLPSSIGCGTTSRQEFPIRNKKDVMMTVGLLRQLEDGSEQMITPMDDHLVGTTIMLRTPLDCNTRNRGSVCACCSGMFSNISPEGANPGHLSAAEFIEKITQKVLGVKHSEGSATMETIVLKGINAHYFDVGVDGRTFLLKHDLRTSNVEVSIDVSEAENLSEILGDEYDMENSPRIGQISKIDLHYSDNQGRRNKVTIGPTLKSATSHISYDLVRHIRKVNFETTSTSQYKISLKGWDFRKPLFELERRHISMVDFMKQVRAFVTSSDVGTRRHLRNGGGEILSDFHDVNSALVSLHRLVNETISVNVVHLAMCIKAMQAVGHVSRGPDANYQIPLLGEPWRFARYNNLIAGRSASGKMIYQGQTDYLDDPAAYNPDNRPYHPADVTFIR